MADSIERYFFGKDRSPEPIVVLNSVLNAPPAMVISIIGNVLVLVAVLRTPSIRSCTILLWRLTLSDLLVGVIVQPLYLATFLKRNRSVLNSSTTSFIASGASLFTMTAIAVNRFLALHDHIRYAALMTRSRAKYSVLALLPPCYQAQVSWIGMSLNPL